MGQYDQSCSDCKHEDTDIYDNCSMLTDEGCSCHISPPCYFCVNLNFEEKETNAPRI